MKDYGFINTISSVATDEFTEINKCQQADVRKFAFSKDSNYICEVKPDIMNNSQNTISPLMLVVLFFYSAVNKAIMLIGGGKSQTLNHLDINNYHLGTIIPKHGQSFTTLSMLFCALFSKDKMKAKEFKRLFKDPDNDDLTAKYGSLLRRTDHQGNYECLLCGRHHSKGLKYTFNNEEVYICHSCHQALFYGKRARNLAEVKKD